MSRRKGSMFPKLSPDAAECRRRQARNRKLMRQHGVKRLTIPYHCDCGRRGELAGEYVPGGEYFHCCPECGHWMLLGAPTGTAVK